MSQDETHRAKVMRLADALMQDILTASDDDILSEVDVVHIQRARTIFLGVKARTSKQLLDTAKIGFEGWRSLQIRVGGQLNNTETREQFEKILRDDPVLNEKITV